MLWDWKILTKSLLDKLNIFLVVLHSTGNNEALLRSDVVHNELLNHPGINVVEVLFQSQSGHAEGVEAIGGPKEHFLLIGKWVKLGEMFK